MPTGPIEWHEYWTNRGPTPDGSENAILFLKGEGLLLTNKWNWVSRRFSKWDDLPEEAKYAINYLVAEWDFGSFGGKIGD